MHIWWMEWTEEERSLLLQTLPLSLSLSLSLSQDECGVFLPEAHAATTQTKTKINMLSLWHLPAGNRRLRRLNKSEQRIEWKEWEVLNETDKHEWDKESKRWRWGKSWGWDVVYAPNKLKETFFIFINLLLNYVLLKFVFIINMIIVSCNI